MVGEVWIYSLPRPCAKSKITSEQKNLFERYGYRKNCHKKCYRMRCKSKVYCEQKENSKVGQFNRIRLDQDVGQKRQIWRPGARLEKEQKMRICGRTKNNEQGKNLPKECTGGEEQGVR